VPGRSTLMTTSFLLPASTAECTCSTNAQVWQIKTVDGEGSSLRLGTFQQC
jgi:hypothetical protein